MASPLEEARFLLIKFFGAIDTVLNIHTSSHPNDPEISHIVKQVTSITRRTCNPNHIFQILYIYPDSYLVLRSEKDGEYVLGIPTALKSVFHKNFAIRKQNFTEKLEKWLSENHTAQKIPACNIDLQLQKCLSEVLVMKSPRKSPTKSSIKSPTKICKLSPTKASLKTIKNDSTKFHFKEKNELDQLANNKGLSLLERIKLKEKQKKQNDLIETPEDKYAKYIKGKLQAVYNVLFLQAVGLGVNEYKSFSMNKLCEIVIDSLDYPMGAAEIKNAIIEISNRIETVKVLQKDGLYAVKIGILQRNENLLLLN